MALTPSAVELLGPYLARQRWYAGAREPDSGSLRLLESDCLAETPGGRRLQWAIVGVDELRYQLLLADEPTKEGADIGPPADAAGRLIPAAALLGAVGGRRFYDAVVDPELMLLFYERLADAPATRVRLVGAEQSNTSLVFDERVILKLYRRLAEGVNPDIEVTSALAMAGFDHVAEPVATWRADGVDLAFAQRFLAGGAEGWALAVASARELIFGPEDDPAAAPGDFVSESEDLGHVSAGLHLALAGAFGVDEDVLAATWGGFVDDLEQRTKAELARGTPVPGGEEDPDGPDAGPDTPSGDAVKRVFERLRAVRRPGPALRIHGDFHLGQVMRADGRWYALDFEGEPTRSLEERTRRSSAAKDVAGMLRSIDYAARYALREVGEGSAGTIAEGAVARAAAWERRIRAAFLRGYRATPGVGALMAEGSDGDAVLAAFELDKALYELRYEEAYRPDWVGIPRTAIGRTLARLGRPAEAQAGIEWVDSADD